MTQYRVEKDGRSFYIRPEQLGYYESEGFSIYKTVEVPVSDVKREIGSIKAFRDTGYSESLIGGNANETK